MTTNKTKDESGKNSDAGKKARMCNNPVLMSAFTSEAFTKSMLPNMDIGVLIDELNKETLGVMDGDISMMEGMLVGQAKALQTIFVSLARRAANQEYLKQYGAYMTLALKAQSQSRATIQALTELKYPKQVAFVKQANIANGNQQVNNGDIPNTSKSSTHAHEKEIQNQPNELLAGEQYGNTRMDNRAKTSASRKNKAMATLEK